MDKLTDYDKFSEPVKIKTRTICVLQITSFKIGSCVPFHLVFTFVIVLIPFVMFTPDMHNYIDFLLARTSVLHMKDFQIVSALCRCFRMKTKSI